MERIILNAKEGMIFTNGEAYGKTVDLGVNDKPENWYEITEEEYNKIMEDMSYEKDLYQPRTFR